MENTDPGVLRAACERYFKDLMKRTFPSARFDMFFDVENAGNLPSMCADVYVNGAKWSVLIDLKRYADSLSAVEVWMTCLSDMSVPAIVFHADPVTLESDYKATEAGLKRFEEKLSGWKRTVATGMKYRHDGRPVRFRDAVMYHWRRK